MKKLLNDIRNDKVIHYILIILATCIAAIPLIKLRIYGTDDGYVHILRILGLDKALASGQFPPILYSGFCRGFGYPVNLFYPPIVTFLPLIFRVFTSHYYMCLKIYSFFTILISGFTMYHMVREITDKREIAIIASIIYIFIPYRLETIYNRFAIGEFTAYIFLPLLFQGLYSIMKKDGKKHYYIAIAATGLMLSHTITTEYAAIFSAFYIFMNYKGLKNKGVIKKIVINVLFILGLSALFLGPLFEHKISGNYTIFSSKSMYATGEWAGFHSIRISQLFKDISQLTVSLKLGITFTILILLGIFTFRKTKKEYKETYSIFFIIALISLWMATKYFPWIYMPDIIATLQYPWRMLTFFEFVMAMLCAINLYTFIQIVNKNKSELIEGLLISISIGVIICSMMKINYDYRYEDSKSYENEEYEEWVNSQKTLSHFSINRDYLPLNAIKVQHTYLAEREDRIYLLEGNANISNENKNGLNLTAAISNATSGDVLEMPYLYYLGYEITIKHNNQIIKLQNFESEYGFVAVKIPEDIEEGTITVKYTGTVMEKASYIMSAISFAGFIIYIVQFKRKEKINENKSGSET